MTKEQRADRDRQKRRDWKEEIARLYMERERRLEPSDAQKRRHERNSRVILEAWAFMVGPDFRRWIEATTGEDADEWLDGLRQRIEQTRMRGRPGFSEIDMLRGEIERVAQQHRWADPEQRALWAREIASASGGQERRRIVFRLATPRWANIEKVVAMYAERDRLTVATGIAHEVDHVYPLVSREVCGLHCEFNLRVIPMPENRAKSNRMPSWDGPTGLTS